MSMHPEPIPVIPEEAVRIAHAMLPEGNMWMQMRDGLGPLYEDTDFADLFPTQCMPVAAKVLRLRPDEATNTALVAARQRQQTPEFWKQLACIV